MSIKRKLKKFSLFEDNSRSRSLGGNIVSTVFTLLICGFMLVPVIYTLNMAFKPLEELHRFPPTFIVQNPTLSNFTDLFNLLNEAIMPFSRYFFNTVCYTAIIAVLRIITGSLGAYALSKIPFPGSKAIFKLITFTLMFSAVVTGTPTYIILVKLGMVDTLSGVIIPCIADTMGFYLIKNFMETNVPGALLEAGRIDGANELTIFFKIAMPLVKPAWYTLIILSIQGLWGAAAANSYREIFKTLPQALTSIGGGIERSGISAASSLLMLIVPFACFIFMQSKIIDTMSSAGIK